MIRYVLLLVFTMPTGKVEIPFLSMCTSFDACVAYAKVLEAMPNVHPGVSFRCIPQQQTDLGVSANPLKTAK